MEIKNEEKMMELLKMCMEGNPDVKVQVSIKMKKKKHKSPKNLEENGDMPVEDSSHARIVELEAENGELNKTIEQQNMEITELKDKNESLQFDNAELKEDCENAERTISDKEAEITELKDKNENLQFENAELKENCENAEKTISDKETEITELKDKNENLQFENAELKENCENAERTISDKETEITELKDKNENLQFENAELKENCENAERTISDKKAEITELKDKNENLQFENADYKIAKKKLQPFEELISLYQKAKTINEFCPLSLDLESPLKFLFCVASEQAVGSLYEKLRYNYKAVSKKVSVAIELYNELVDFMCSINPKFAAIDELGEMDDEHHAEINQKHEGQIKTILMKGYQYSVSGTVEKKAFVEVI